MHVAHFEAGALTRQTAGAEGGNTTLVRDFRQRVGLVHELRQLAGTEEFLDRGADRLGIDQVMRHQVIGFGLRQAFLDGTFDAHQSGTELVFRQFANGTHATIAEVIDVVDFTATIAQFDQDLDDFDDVARRQRQLLAHLGVGTQRLDLGQQRFGLAGRQVFRQGAGTIGQQADQVLNGGQREPRAFREILQRCFGLGGKTLDRHLELGDIGARQATIELHAANAGQVVTFVGIEQAVEQDLDRFFGRRLARAHHAIDGDAGSLAGGGFIGAQRVGDERATIEFVGVQRLQRRQRRLRATWRAVFR